MSTSISNCQSPRRTRPTPGRFASTPSDRYPQAPPPQHEIRSRSYCLKPFRPISAGKPPQHDNPSQPNCLCPESPLSAGNPPQHDKPARPNCLCPESPLSKGKIPLYPTHSRPNCLRTFKQLSAGRTPKAIFHRYLPVTLCGLFLTSSTVPKATIFPP